MVFTFLEHLPSLYSALASPVNPNDSCKKNLYFFAPVGGCVRVRERKIFIPTSPNMGGALPPPYYSGTVTFFPFWVTSPCDHVLAFG